MSRRATGTITTTREGRHRVRVPADGRRVDVGTYDTREEAERELAAAMAVLGEMPHAGVLFGDWLDNHLGERETSKRFRDSDNERSYFTRHVETDALAKMPLKSVRPDHVDDFLDRLRSKKKADGNPLARDTVVKVFGIVRGGFKAAKRKRIVKADPTEDIRIAPERRTEEPWTYATSAEQDALVDAARAHCAATPRLAAIPLDALLDFAMGSGLRAGEIVTLRLADVMIDGDAPQVKVRYGTAPDLPTKTGKPRDVPLFDRALRGMRRWLATMPTWVEENPDGLVFVGPRGGYRSENHVIRWDDWKAILERAGITRRFRWHDLRHTCASSLVSGFWSRAWTLEEVRGLLGHEDADTTEKYAHLAASAVQRAARETDLAQAKRRGGAGGSGGAGGEGSASGGAGGERDANRSRPTIASLSAAQRAGFLKRWSAVRIGSGAPNDSAVVDAAGRSTRVRLATDSSALLLAVERGDGAEVERLARAVAEPVARLALDVLAGGPFMVARALELVELLPIPEDDLELAPREKGGTE